MTKQQRVHAANKAVHTLRLNKLCRANLNEIIEITNQIFEAELRIDYDYSTDGIISKEIGKTTWQSFCRFGDRNKATKAMILQWIDNTATPLDNQAQYMTNEFGKEIEPSELADFMIENDRGLNSYGPIEMMNNLKWMFRETAGFNFDRKFARKVILKKEAEPVPADAPF